MSEQACDPVVSPVPAATKSVPVSTKSGPVRFQVFVDFWNLQLTLNRHEAKRLGVDAAAFGINWQALPAVLVREAAKILGVTDRAYAGMLVFTSYTSRNDAGAKHHKWATTWLDRQPGVHVVCFERQPRSHTNCQKCHRPVNRCPYDDCKEPLAGMIEKGVDTAIATDMIRLAWESAYDVAVLVTSDADLVPAVKFLELKGLKVVQAGFPPYGAELAKTCWGNFDVFACRDEFRREIKRRT